MTLICASTVPKTWSGYSQQDATEMTTTTTRINRPMKAKAVPNGDCVLHDVRSEGRFYILTEVELDEQVMFSFLARKQCDTAASSADLRVW